MIKLELMIEDLKWGETMDNIENVIIDKVKQLLDFDGEINEEQDLRSIGLDSLTSVELIVFLEEYFNIFFSEDELLLDNFSTVSQIKQSVVMRCS